MTMIITSQMKRFVVIVAEAVVVSQINNVII